MGTIATITLSDVHSALALGRVTHLGTRKLTAMCAVSRAPAVPVDCRHSERGRPPSLEYSAARHGMRLHGCRPMPLLQHVRGHGAL